MKKIFPVIIATMVAGISYPQNVERLMRKNFVPQTYAYPTCGAGSRPNHLDSVLIYKNAISNTGIFDQQPLHLEYVGNPDYWLYVYNAIANDIEVAQPDMAYDSPNFTKQLINLFLKKIRKRRFYH